MAPDEQGTPDSGQDLFGPESDGALRWGAGDAGTFHVTGVPGNGLGVNGDWAFSDNGHVYFKTAGAWAQKV